MQYRELERANPVWEGVLHPDFFGGGLQDIVAQHRKVSYDRHMNKPVVGCDKIMGVSPTQSQNVGLKRHFLLLIVTDALKHRKTVSDR